MLPGMDGIEFAKRLRANSATKSIPIIMLTAKSDEDNKIKGLNIGADVVVNHKEKNWGRHILEITKGKKIHRAIDVDFGANLTEVLSCLRTGAIIATYASMQNPEPKIPFFKMMYMALSIRLIIVYSMPEKAKFNAIKDINNLLSKNLISHRIAHKVSLDEIHKSHEIIKEGNARGGVLIEMS
jgi:NADPH:quinone reductase-like Zn-dependent oxidoreductase